MVDGQQPPLSQSRRMNQSSSVSLTHTKTSFYHSFCCTKTLIPMNHYLRHFRTDIPESPKILGQRSTSPQLLIIIMVMVMLIIGGLSGCSLLRRQCPWHDTLLHTAWNVSLGLTQTSLYCDPCLNSPELIRHFIRQTDSLLPANERTQYG